MPISSEKGHSARVVEYRAGLEGIVSFPWDSGAEDGWWWPSVGGVQARTKRQEDTPATPYVLLVSDKRTPILEVRHPKSIGRPGNTQPAGPEHWSHGTDGKICVSWDWYYGRVYMRGVVIIDGLSAIVAATIYGGRLFVFTASGVVSCLIDNLKFLGITAENNSLLEPGPSYGDSAFGSNPITTDRFGYYVSPLGSSVVLLTRTHIRTFTITSDGEISLSETSQPEEPNTADLGTWTRDDDYTQESFLEPNDFNETLTLAYYDDGGYSGAVSGTLDYSYQYGVVWSGESPQAVMLNITNTYSMDYDQELHALHAVWRLNTSNMTEIWNYGESQLATISGGGVNATLREKSMSHTRTYTHAYEEGWDAGGNYTCDMQMIIESTDATKKTKEIVRSPGRVVINNVYTGDESADNKTLNKLLEGTDGKRNLSTRYHPFTGNFDLDATFFGYGDMTFEGAVAQNTKVELDGSTVFTSDTNNDNGNPATIIGAYLRVNSIKNEVKDWGWDRSEDGDPLYWAGNLYEDGFMRNNKTGRNEASGYATRLGKSVAFVEATSGGNYGMNIFASDHADAMTLMDLPPGAEIKNLSVI